MARKQSPLSARDRKTVKKAQDRLRRANSFMKRVAESQGINLSLRGKSESEQRIVAQQAQYIASSAEFTARGFKKWKKSLADELRIGTKELDYVLSQIDVENMEFIENSKLRYGSNPQLDYAFDSAIELKNEYKKRLEMLEENEEDTNELLEEIF